MKCLISHDKEKLIKKVHLLPRKNFILTFLEGILKENDKKKTFKKTVGNIENLMLSNIIIMMDLAVPHEIFLLKLPKISTTMQMRKSQEVS